MRNVAVEKSINRSLRLQMATALGVIAVLVGGVGGVSAYTEISGAVIGSGSIIVAGRAKEVQHRDGGTVATMDVREGDRVQEGELLFTLDDTVEKANLAIVTSQLHQLLAAEARLMAEQSGAQSIGFPAEVSGAEKRLATLRIGQVELFQARRATLAGRKAQLGEQISQFAEKIAALEAEQAAVRENLRLLEDQVGDFSILHGKGLLLDSQLVTLQRERATLVGSLAALQSEAVESQQAIGERELQKVQIEEEFLEEVLTELDLKRVEIARLNQEQVAANDRLKRLAIRSPLSGYVHKLNVHTIGRVVAPGETLMQVIPMDDDLIVEAKLSPTDVDQVFPGQPTRMRLTGLDQRVTPELDGHILDVSPDLLTDPNSGLTYYTARVEIPAAEEARLAEQDLRPGMPVEVFVETSTRTILSYLAKPLQDQITHAMREN